MTNLGLAAQIFRAGRRRARRAVADDACRIGLGGAARFTADLIDIAPGGCLVRTPAIVGEGQPVRLGLPGLCGEVGARVVWSIGSRIGLAFDDELAADAYALVLATVMEDGGG